MISIHHVCQIQERKHVLQHNLVVVFVKHIALIAVLCHGNHHKEEGAKPLQ